MLNALTVDLEDYFHPTEVQPYAPDWSSLPSRVEWSTRRVLDVLAESGVHATFFVLGWVAERYPALIRKVAADGHEIACHSYAHRLVYSLSPEEFRADTTRARQVIEDACGVSPTAYRAPSYSITTKSLWALEILAEQGFAVDSSIYPIVHDRYGVAGFERRPVMMPTASGSILEIPISTVRLSGGRIAPVGGGGYLRLLPYAYTAAGIRRLNAEEGRPACIYFHPWEIDPGQPRLASGMVARARTYIGLGGMERKIRRLLRDFSFTTLSAVFSHCS